MAKVEVEKEMKVDIEKKLLDDPLSGSCQKALGSDLYTRVNGYLKAAQIQE